MSAEEITQKIQTINQTICDLQREVEVLCEERKAVLCGLNDRELLDLRRDLTIIGTAISSRDAKCVSVEIIDEEPECKPWESRKQNLYSIDLSCSYFMDAMALSYSVKIKTKSEGVATIIRRMFHLDDCEDETTRTSWEFTSYEEDTRILVKDPVSEKEYVELEKKLETPSFRIYRMQ